MSFASDIDRFEKRIRQQTGQLVHEAAARVYQGVTFRSPRDTGRFQQSWNISWTIPNEEVAPPGDGPNSVPFVPQELPAIPPEDFPTAFVNNQLPYGPALEGGHSAQASPAGQIVAVTLADVEALL